MSPASTGEVTFEKTGMSKTSWGREMGERERQDDFFFGGDRGYVAWGPSGYLIGLIAVHAENGSIILGNLFNVFEGACLNYVCSIIKYCSSCPSIRKGNEAIATTERIDSIPTTINTASPQYLHTKRV